MTYGEALALASRQARAWMLRDADAIAADFAEDGVLVSPGGRWVGPDGLREAARAFFAEVDRVDVCVGRVVAGADAGAVEWRWEETRRDGTAHVMHDGIIFATRAGRITYWREWF